MFAANPDLTLLVEKNFKHDEPGVEPNVLTGVNGTDFLSFAKNAIYNYGGFTLRFDKFRNARYTIAMFTFTVQRFSLFKSLTE